MDRHEMTYFAQKNPRMLAFYKVLAWLQNFEIFHATLSLHRTCWCTDKLDLFSDKTCHCIYRGQIVVRFDLRREISRYFSTKRCDKLFSKSTICNKLQTLTGEREWLRQIAPEMHLLAISVGQDRHLYKILQNIAKYHKMLQNTTKYCKMPQIIAQILGEIALRCICRRY